MGKGDKKTKRGKLFSGSYGRLRPRKAKKQTFQTTKPDTSAADKKKGRAKKTKE